MFCIQESAKAALKMKDCQMTDRTTQTEHMGPEVRYTDHTLCLSLSLSLSLCLSLSLFLSDTNNSLCISSTENVRYVRMPASPGLRITKRSSFLTKVLITSPFFSILLLCCLICVNAFYAEPKPPSLQPFLFFPTYLRASFSR